MPTFISVFRQPLAIKRRIVLCLGIMGSDSGRDSYGDVGEDGKVSIME